MTFVRKRDFTDASGDQDETPQFNVASTDWVEVSPKVAARFSAPTSGRVWVTVGGGVRDSAGANRVYLAPSVSEAFDTEDEVLAPDEVDNGFTVAPECTDWSYGSRTVLLSGLAAGRRYIANVKYKVEGAATCDIRCREILVEPTT